MTEEGRDECDGVEGREDESRLVRKKTKMRRGREEGSDREDRPCSLSHT